MSTITSLAITLPRSFMCSQLWKAFSAGSSLECSTLASSTIHVDVGLMPCRLVRLEGCDFTGSMRVAEDVDVFGRLLAAATADSILAMQGLENLPGDCFWIIIGCWFS